MGNPSPELLETLELEQYLESGGFIKKDCWLRSMHIRYNSVSEKFELVDSVVTSDGTRIPGVRERYDSILDIPYVGKWIKCTEEGEPLE